jgi:hypothetical protein
MGFHRHAAALAILVSLTSSLLVAPAAAGHAVREPTDGAVPAAAPSTAPLRFGVTTPGGFTATSELDGVAALVGEAPSIVMAYADFTVPAPLDGLNAVVARGATPMITWEPWRAGAPDQSPYALSRIIAGDFDGHISSWARELASWGRPVDLRFAHEMNGDWYPWAEGVNGNRSGQYVAAWRHVHDIFSAAGATNVSWVWGPNVPYPGSTPLRGLYPGHDYVDKVALDGYNWSTVLPWTMWTRPASLFGPGLGQLRKLAPRKPIIIAETASTEIGGSKARWIRSLVRYLAAQPDVTGFIWFDHDKETDWRIHSSPASAYAFTRALAARARR